jgi:hypothetical protein
MGCVGGVFVAWLIDISINRDTGVRRAIYVMNSGIFNKLVPTPWLWYLPMRQLA